MRRAARCAEGGAVLRAEGTNVRCVTDSSARALARLYDHQLRILAAHYSNMGSGRADSAGYVANYFHELVGLVRPVLFLEAGAYKAEASRRVRDAHPGCRVVAFEANRYNVEQYRDEVGAGIEYLNLAVTDRPGPVTFNLRSRHAGESLRRVTGNSSLLRRVGDETEYEELTVDGVTLDGFVGEAEVGGPIGLWIDVEGASRQVLSGAASVLARTELILIEVEERPMWEGQWRALDVLEHLVAAGFVPLTRDIEYEQQCNIVFVRTDVYERAEVLRSLELHTNYLAQHMGVR
jgi:FkbM family methyltransferase